MVYLTSFVQNMFGYMLFMTLYEQQQALNIK